MLLKKLMHSWRNWQTRKTKDLVGNSMQVQLLLSAPDIKAREPLLNATASEFFI